MRPRIQASDLGCSWWYVLLKLLKSLKAARERREVGEEEGFGSQECLTDAMVPRDIFADRVNAL